MKKSFGICLGLAIVACSLSIEADTLAWYRFDELPVGERASTTTRFLNAVNADRFVGYPITTLRDQYSTTDPSGSPSAVRHSRRLISCTTRLTGGICRTASRWNSGQAPATAAANPGVC